MNDKAAVSVRKYAASDRAALIDLWRRVFPDDPPHNEPGAVIDAKLAVDDLIFVAETNGQLVGACQAGYDGHRGWLYAVAVLPGQRQAGIGSRLVASAEQALRARGCIKVNLQIRAGNHAVSDFYRALGYSVEERISMGKRID